MGVHVVIGGQFGSEGKGKVSLYFAKQLGVSFTVKVSGTNAGHTVYSHDGTKHILRVLNSAMVIPSVHCVLSAGCCFSPELLFREMEELGVSSERVHIDPNAGIITDGIKQEEKSLGLCGAIGSTGSGTGYVTVHRILCDGKFVSAKMIPSLEPLLCDTVALMRDALDRGQQILIEGCQGYGLSLLHTPYYPYCTSRDTTASWFVAEAGLSPFDVETIIMVLRTYPIRVAGNSGPLPNEVDWATVTREARSPTPIIEHTSVTRNVRRVARFDPEIVRSAQAVNRSNIVVMNFMDYIWDEEPGVVGPRREEFIDMVERTTGCRITHLGFSGDSVVPYNRR